MSIQAGRWQVDLHPVTDGERCNSHKQNEALEPVETAINILPGVGKIGEDGKDGTEIDIVEIPWRDGQITMNLHWDGYGKDHKSAGTKTTIPALTEGFHDYGLLWTKEQYVFYVDGREVWRSTAGGVSQVPEYLKLTEEIGKWGGDITKAELPDYFEVDYVRVYDLNQ